MMLQSHRLGGRGCPGGRLPPPQHMAAALPLAARRHSVVSPAPGDRSTTTITAEAPVESRRRQSRRQYQEGGGYRGDKSNAPKRRPPGEGQPRDMSGRSKPSVRKALDGVLRSARAQAVQQLVRVELEAAYAGRVAGRIRAIGPDAGPAGADERDARFVKALVAGVTRWRRRLDFVLDHLTQGRVSQLDPVQLQILRLGLFELVELDAPPHIISEHVDLAKSLVYPGAAGLTNGVLRSAARHRDAGTLPAPALPAAPPPALDAAQAEALAVATSHPTWMVARWAARYGPAETFALLRANNQEPAHGVRVCSPALRADLPGFLEAMAAGGVAVADSALLPGEFVRVEGGLQHLLARHVSENADCQVQDEAAGLVVAMLDPQPGEDVLDACAAPGGKTLFAAARMQAQGRVLALDRSERKLGALSSIARQQNLGLVIRTQVDDLRDFSREQQRLRSTVPRHLSDGGPAPTPAVFSWQTPAASPPQEAAAAVAPAAAAPAAGAAGGASSLVGAPAPHFAAQRERAVAAAAEKAAKADAAAAVQRGRAAAPLPTEYDRVLVDVPCSGLGVLAKRADLRWRRKAEDLAELVDLQRELLEAAAGLVKPGGVLVYSTCSIEPEENEMQVAAFLANYLDFSLEAPPASARLPPGVLTPEGCLATLPHVHGTDGAFAARMRRRDLSS